MNCTHRKKAILCQRSKSYITSPPRTNKLQLHLEKKAIRALGIAESFRQRDKFSTLVGVVMRSDLVIDGFTVGKLRVSGSDATKSVLSLFHKLNRNDVNAMLLSGSVLSLYNIIDVDSIHKELRIPVVALTFRKSRSDLVRNIKSRFRGKKAEEKIKLLKKLGEPEEISLATGYRVFVRTAGISKILAKRLLDRFTLQGAVPEPIRVSRLLAKSVARASRAEE
jgi:uncharacterized protein